MLNALYVTLGVLNALYVTLGVLNALYVTLGLVLGVFSATFNNISVKFRQSVLLIGRVESVYSENTTDLPQVTDNLYRIKLY